ncbi:MAG: hypothetical protein PUJ57_04140 [Peptoniphilaceae bacterium]|nr:hypothetical protein [Peptoniphilaceae bacterium]MDY6085244.1 hypothetical protein [Peptoniphilaceae bacterium]
MTTGGRTTLGADNGIGMALAMCGGVSFKKWMKYLLPLFIVWWGIAFFF